MKWIFIFVLLILTIFEAFSEKISPHPNPPLYNKKQEQKILSHFISHFHKKLKRQKKTSSPWSCNQLKKIQAKIDLISHREMDQI